MSANNGTDSTATSSSSCSSFHSIPFCSLTPEQFSSEFMSTNRPVVLTELMTNWRANQLWTKESNRNELESEKKNTDRDSGILNPDSDSNHFQLNLPQFSTVTELFSYCRHLVNHSHTQFPASASSSSSHSRVIDFSSFRSLYPSDPTLSVASCSSQYFNDSSRNEMKLSEYLHEWENGLDGMREGREKVKYVKDWHLMLQEEERLRKTRGARTEEKESTGQERKNEEGPITDKEKSELTEKENEELFYQCPPHFQDDWMNLYWTRKEPSLPTSATSSSSSSDDYRFVYLGPAGCWTPLHYDVFCSYSWSANVVGYKLWILIHPDAAKYVMKSTYAEGEGGSKKEWIWDLLAAKQDQSLFPSFHSLQLHHLHLVIQPPGTIIFVPSKWMHQVHNLTDCISINHNWNNRWNVQMMRELISEEEQMARKELSEFQFVNPMKNTKKTMKQEKEESKMGVEKEDEEVESMVQLMLRQSAGMNVPEFIKFLNWIKDYKQQQLSQLLIGNEKRRDWEKQELRWSIETCDRLLRTMNDKATHHVKQTSFNTHNFLSLSSFTSALPAFAPFTSSSSSTSFSPTPVMLLTDPGRDIDDILALLLLRDAELSLTSSIRLVGVITSGSEAKWRAEVVKWWMNKLGWKEEEVPVASQDDKEGEGKENEAGSKNTYLNPSIRANLSDSSTSKSSSSSSLSATSLLLSLCAVHFGRLHLICIAPLTPLAAALSLHPSLIRHSICSIAIQGQANEADEEGKDHYEKEKVKEAAKGKYARLRPNFESFNLREDRIASEFVFSQLSSHIPFHLLGKYTAYQISLSKQDLLLQPQSSEEEKSKSGDEKDGMGSLVKELEREVLGCMKVFRNGNPRLFRRLYEDSNVEEQVEEGDSNAESDNPVWWQGLKVVSHPYDPLLLLSLLQPELFDIDFIAVNSSPSFPFSSSVASNRSLPPSLAVHTCIGRSADRSGVQDSGKMKAALVDRLRRALTRIA